MLYLIKRSLRFAGAITGPGVGIIMVGIGVLVGIGVGWVSESGFIIFGSSRLAMTLYVEPLKGKTEPHKEMRKSFNVCTGGIIAYLL